MTLRTTAVLIGCVRAASGAMGVAGVRRATSWHEWWIGLSKISWCRSVGAIVRTAWLLQWCLSLSFEFS